VAGCAESDRWRLVVGVVARRSIGFRAGDFVLV
jgi:hypothetical protein